jgi:heme-degrading monooxygenase HmoA
MAADEIATTPEPPYCAVIFTSRHSGAASSEYAAVAALMRELASEQPGYLGVETASDPIGITVSYWRDEESIRAWRNHVEHTVARERGRTEWYTEYVLRVATVERETRFSAPVPPARSATG